MTEFTICYVATCVTIIVVVAIVGEVIKGPQ